MNSKSQSGNVLFLILIAVALFAALSYAVTSSSRSSGSNANAEKAQTNAAAIVNFGSTVKTAMMRMKISNDCQDNMFDFTNSVYKLMNGAAMNSTNNNAPASKKCHLFDPAGGGVSPVLFSKDIGDFTGNPDATPGHVLFRVAKVAGAGTDTDVTSDSSKDLVLSVLYLTKETCMAIDKLVGVDTLGNSPPSGPIRSDGDYIDGSFGGSNAYYGAAEITGKDTFCIRMSTGKYEFVQVVLAR